MNIIRKRDSKKAKGIENGDDYIVAGNGDFFEGTRNQWRDCYFDNATNEQITDFCKKQKLTLDINRIKIL